MLFKERLIRRSLLKIWTLFLTKPQKDQLDDSGQTQNEQQWICLNCMH